MNSTSASSSNGPGSIRYCSETLRFIPTAWRRCWAIEGRGGTDVGANRGIAVSKAVVRPNAGEPLEGTDLLEIVSRPRSGGQSPPPCHGSRKPNFSLLTAQGLLLAHPFHSTCGGFIPESRLQRAPGSVTLCRRRNPNLCRFRVLRVAA